MTSYQLIISIKFLQSTTCACGDTQNDTKTISHRKWTENGGTDAKCGKKYVFVPDKKRAGMRKKSPRNPNVWLIVRNRRSWMLIRLRVAETNFPNKKKHDPNFFQFDYAGKLLSNFRCRRKKKTDCSTIGIG